MTRKTIPIIGELLPSSEPKLSPEDQASERERQRKVREEERARKNPPQR